MRVPSKIIDISIPLDNETVADPAVMRPKIEYVSNKENAELMCSMFPGLRPSDLPDGEVWSWEKITFMTHNGTLFLFNLWRVTPGDWVATRGLNRI
jgi:hypothetical protein